MPLVVKINEKTKPTLPNLQVGEFYVLSGELYMCHCDSPGQYHLICIDDGEPWCDPQDSLAQLEEQVDHTDIKLATVRVYVD